MTAAMRRSKIGVPHRAGTSATSVSWSSVFCLANAFTTARICQTVAPRNVELALQVALLALGALRGSGCAKPGLQLRNGNRNVEGQVAESSRGLG